MLSITIRYKPTGIRWVKAVGEASISVNGVTTYEGRPRTGYNCEFTIDDLVGNSVVRCSSWSKSWWHGFFDNRTFVMKAATGQEIARITSSGFLGARFAITLGSQEFPCPRKREISLPGASFFVTSSPHAVEVTVSDEERTLAFAGIGLYLWIRQGIDDSCNGRGAGFSLQPIVAPGEPLLTETWCSATPILSGTHMFARLRVSSV